MSHQPWGTATENQSAREPGKFDAPPRWLLASTKKLASRSELEDSETPLADTDAAVCRATDSASRAADASAMTSSALRAPRSCKLGMPYKTTGKNLPPRKRRNIKMRIFNVEGQLPRGICRLLPAGIELLCRQTLKKFKTGPPGNTRKEGFSKLQNNFDSFETWLPEISSKTPCFPCVTRADLSGKHHRIGAVPNGIASADPDFGLLNPRPGHP